MVDLTNPVETIVSILKNSSTGIGTTGYEITDDNASGLTISGGQLLVSFTMSKEELKDAFGGSQDYDVIFTIKSGEIEDEWLGLSTKMWKVPIIITIHVIDKWSAVATKYITAPLVLYKAVNALRTFIKVNTVAPGGTINLWKAISFKNEEDISVKPTMFKCIVTTEAWMYYNPFTHTITLNSERDDESDTNLGTITENSTVHDLPDTVTKEYGTRAQVTYTAAGSDEFDSWSVADLVIVEDSTANPTYMHVNGSGTLTAVYKSLGLLFVAYYDTGTALSRIIKVDLDTYTVEGEPLVFPDVGGYIYDMCKDATYLYVFIELNGASTVYKVNKETLAIDDSNVLDEADTDIVGLTYDDTYIYAVCYTTPARVIKINKLTLERADAYTFPEGKNLGRGIGIEGSYIYVILASSPAEVQKLNLSLTPIDSITLSTGENHGGRPLIYNDKMYVPTRYAEGHPDNHIDKVVKIDLATFTREGAIVLSTYAIHACNITREVVDDHFYVGGCFNTEIAKVKVSTFTEVEPVCSFTGGYAQWGMEIKDGFLYIALDVTTPPTITKIDLSAFEVVTVDSHSETNQDGIINLMAVHPSDAEAISACGQCFTTPGSSHKISKAKFYLIREGNPSGTLVAQLYAITGTYGTDAQPTGSVLAESSPVDMGDVGTSLSLVDFIFSDDEQYEMSADTHYFIQCVVKTGSGLDGSNRIQVGTYSKGGTHDGNTAYYHNSAWVDSPTDTCFYVYGDGEVGTLEVDDNVDRLAVSLVLN